MHTRSDWILLLFLCAACGGNPAPNWHSIEVTVEVGRFEAAPPAETLLLAEAQALLPFEFNLPTWLPDGFILQETVEAILPTDDWLYGEVVVTWFNADEAAFTLHATTTPERDSELVGAGETESVAVNGQAATLTRLGLKVAPRRWVLAWKANGIRYELEVIGDVLTEASLMRVAESIP